MSTRAEESRPFAGRTVVVTGASDGIGRAAVRAYLTGGAHVVMVGRNEAKTVAAANRIMSETGERRVTWEIADLSRLEEIRELSQRLLRHHPRIDVLANNAGAMFLERQTTADGIERTFALNHLGYFALTLQLLPALAAGGPAHPARVVCVSSRAHENAHVDLDDLQLAQGYGGWRAYCNSKLFNLWFVRALARRVDPSRLLVQGMHPGVVHTRFATNNGTRGRLLRRLMDVVSITPEAGADTLVWLSHAPEAVAHPAGYWVKRRLRPGSRAARDDARAERLWQESERLTGIDATAMLTVAGVGRAVA